MPFHGTLKSDRKACKNKNVFSSYIHMRKQQLTGVHVAIGALIVLLVGGYFYLSKEPKIEEQVQGNMSIPYTNTSYGISFNYPDTYNLTEIPLSSIGAGQGLQIVLMEKGVVIPENGEGPTSITVTIYEDAATAGTSSTDALDAWIQESPQSNFKLSSLAPPTPTTLDGKPARTYTWDGLYTGRSVVAANNSDIVMLSVTYNGAEDTKKQEDFMALLQTVKLTLTGNATSTPADTQKETSLKGTFVCLPHKGNPDLTTLECMFGIKANDGKYYALDLQGNTENMDTPMNATIEVKGLLVPVEALSSTSWQNYNIVGIMRVSSFTRS